jgi:hypothetical protein
MHVFHDNYYAYVYMHACIYAQMEAYLIDKQEKEEEIRQMEHAVLTDEWYVNSFYIHITIHMHTYIHTYVRTSYIHTSSIHTCIHTVYIHTHTHTARCRYDELEAGVADVVPRELRKRTFTQVNHVCLHTFVHVFELTLKAAKLSCLLHRTRPESLCARSAHTRKRTSQPHVHAATNCIWLYAYLHVYVHACKYTHYISRGFS